MSAGFAVLFVEDDDGIRETTAATLAAHGVRLLVAEGSEDALDLIAREHIDVLFTDIVVPGLNGIELAKRAKAQQPDIKIMFMTAYYSRAAEAQQLGKLLFKPLRAREIIEELDELLGVR
jgi:DNA-binding NtrC family response regulator